MRLILSTGPPPRRSAAGRSSPTRRSSSRPRAATPKSASSLISSWGGESGGPTSSGTEAWASNSILRPLARWRHRWRASLLRQRASEPPPAIAAALEADEIILSRLAKLGHHRGESQTPEEFAVAVARGDGSLTALRDVTRIYYSARFGRRDLDDEATDSLRRFARSLRERIRAKG